ncbi:MAG: adenylyltransferase/cytidyltransferase family protein [Bacteroidetes bacterium]|nr:adenylyltransferase/cytidyltransferase family protein [Bacteroidota bacterium]
MFKNVYVIGAFDLFHKGHVELLKRAKEIGEKLIVAINSDRLISEYKRKPIYDENHRLQLVLACRYVDEAFIIDTYDNKSVIIEKKISAIVHGDDWPLESYLDQIRCNGSFLKTNNVEMVLLPYTSGVSTSDIITKIKNS